MTTNTRELALKRMQKEVEPLKERFGSKRIERLVQSVRSAEPSVEAINMISSQAADLLKLEPSDELVQQVTKAIDRLFKSHLEQDIARYSVMKIAIVLMKRDEEFLKDLFSAYKKLSEINPLLFIGATYDSSFREILFFSSEGLGQWVEDGKALFCSGGSVNIPEFTRYCGMVSIYADVSKYKISENAVFLEEVQDSLTMFAMHKFDRRLVARKSKAHTPHVTEQDTISIYLPDHFAAFPDKKDNEREYYMTTLHEGSHLALGSFVLELGSVAGTLEERGITIKRIKFREDTNELRVKSILLEKEGKEFLCTSLFHLLPLLADPKHSGFLKVLSNVLDDLRVDSFWLEEKAPGYCQDALRNIEYFMFDGKIRKLPTKFTASEFMEGLLYVSTFLALAEDRKRFLDALGSGDVSGLPKEEAEIVEKLRKMEPKVLALALSCEDELLMLARSRERNSSSVFKATMGVYDKVKHILEDEQTNDIEGEGEGKERMEGMSGPLSLSDIDPDNVEFSLDPNEGVDMNELPEELRDKLKKKFDEKFKGMSEKDKQELAEETAGRAMGESKEDDSADKQPVSHEQEVPGKWDVELVEGKPIPEYVTVHSKQPKEMKSEADALVSGNIRNIARMIMTRRSREVCDALYGEADPIAREEWKRMRRMGMLLPRTYHLRSEIIRVRSLSVLAIADASGSTGTVLNGKRKIDYITASVHSLAEGLSGVPGISFSYGFFHSYGRDNVSFYPGNGFNEPLHFIGIQPDNANRDGAIMRHAGKLLSGQRTDTKIALFVNDSMPADTDEYNGRRGVEDVRHALAQLKGEGILFFVITVPPDQRYYSGEFQSMEQYLDYLYLARGNYAVISTEKELDRAFSAFVKANLPKLRRTEHR